MNVPLSPRSDVLRDGVEREREAENGVQDERKGVVDNEVQEGQIGLVTKNEVNRGEEEKCVDDLEEPLNSDYGAQQPV